MNYDGNSNITNIFQNKNLKEIINNKIKVNNSFSKTGKQLYSLNYDYLAKNNNCCCNCSNNKNNNNTFINDINKTVKKNTINNDNINNNSINSLKKYSNNISNHILKDKSKTLNNSLSSKTFYTQNNINIQKKYKYDKPIRYLNLNSDSMSKLNLENRILNYSSFIKINKPIYYNNTITHNAITNNRKRLTMSIIKNKIITNMSVNLL